MGWKEHPATNSASPSWMAMTGCCDCFLWFDLNLVRTEWPFEIHLFRNEDVADSVPLSMEVWVDTHDFRPWHFEEVEAVMRAKAAKRTESPR